MSISEQEHNMARSKMEQDDGWIAHMAEQDESYIDTHTYSDID